MQTVDIRSRCSVNTNRNQDTFVGIKCAEGEVCINFPIGYRLSEDNDGLRDDILKLFSVLAVNTGKKDSTLSNDARVFEDVAFPLHAYIYVIKDYIQRGYYHEKDHKYEKSKSGKVSWSRTIKTQKPYLQGTEVYYLDLVVKKNTVREDNLITLIHEFCVYESFEKLGWIFTKSMPNKPRIKKQNRLFKSVVKRKISETFNERNKRLFLNIFAILDSLGDKETNENYFYGTYRFEYVWEKMIDKAFGIENKAIYFPRTTWKIKGVHYNNASLEPDTIMVFQGNVYILDAKYYKYGVTQKPWDLPESTSINKQITYGEFVASQEKFKEIHGTDMKVYNAFLMPYRAVKEIGEVSTVMRSIGEAVSDWKDNSETYQKIQGILIDVKFLMHMTGEEREEETMNLAKKISSSEEH